MVSVNMVYRQKLKIHLADVHPFIKIVHWEMLQKITDGAKGLENVISYLSIRENAMHGYF